MLRFTLREECTGYYLGNLSPGGVIIRSEVWLVAGTARLARATARVPAHDAPRRQPLYPSIECACGRHILEELAWGCISETCGVGHYLGDLLSRSVAALPVIRPIAGIAWFAWSTASIP